jgi:isopenicillin N synthase-like dioxygenase
MSIQTVDFVDPFAPSKFVESLLITGFAVLTNHPISQKLIFDTYGDWERFFADDEKQKYRFKENEQSGFFPMDVAEKAKGSTIKDLKEYYNYYDWAPCPQKVSANTQKIYTQLLDLGSTLLEWIEKETPPKTQSLLSEPLSNMIKDSRRNLLRIIHYPPLTGSETAGAIRSAPHEDINLITLLPASTQPGLQVKDISGTWHSLMCDPGAIIVNTGEMLDIAADGFFKATSHQVVNPSGEQINLSRFSMPFFLHPRSDVRLKGTRTAGDFLDERLRELGLKS